MPRPAPRARSGVRDAAAQDVIKIGACLSLVGGFQTVGRQALAGAKLYMQLNGDRVAGKKIELIVRDDTGVPDVARRIVQEMIVNEKVNIVLGGITPTALALGQLVTQAKIPTVVIISGASITIDRSPYMARTSFTLGQSSMIMGDWAAKNGSKKVVTLVNDWAPGAESETAFVNAFTAGGGQVIEKLKVPLANPDFAPFLQRIRDLEPDTAFIYFPGQQGGTFARQFVERGLDKANIKIIGPGDLTDDDELPGQGDVMLGVVTAHNYSAAHPSADEQEVCRGVQEGEQLPPELHLDRRLGRHAPDLRGAEEDQWLDRRRRPDRRHEGHEVGKPARPDLDRSGDARHRAEHLYAQGREGERRAVQCRVRRPSRPSKIPMKKKAT